MVKKKKKNPHAGYTVLTVWVRDELAAVLDEHVESERARVRASSHAEPHVSRTSVVIKALSSMLTVGSDDAGL
jgi:hypothetical protein